MLSVCECGNSSTNNTGSARACHVIGHAMSLVMPCLVCFKYLPEFHMGLLVNLDKMPGEVKGFLSFVPNLCWYLALDSWWHPTCRQIWMVATPHKSPPSDSQVWWGVLHFPPGVLLGGGAASHGVAQQKGGPHPVHLGPVPGSLWGAVACCGHNLWVGPTWCESSRPNPVVEQKGRVGRQTLTMRVDGN